MKDRILIPIVLALYIGVLIFTGTLESAVIDAWPNLLLLTTPLGILLVIAGATTIAVMVIKERRRAKC